jgi:hypothetical protein
LKKPVSIPGVKLIWFLFSLYPISISRATFDPLFVFNITSGGLAKVDHLSMKKGLTWMTSRLKTTRVSWMP